MATEVKNEQQTPEQKAMMKKVAELMPNAQVFAPREGGTYYGPILYAGKNYVAQQVGEGTVVAHPRAQVQAVDSMGQQAYRLGPKSRGDVVSVAWTKENGAYIEAADPERWKERAARVPASPEHSAAAREALGEKFGVYYPPAPEAGLSPRYDGVVAGVTDTALIQRINSRTAIVHEVGADVARQYGAGQEVSVSYDNGKLMQVSAIERPKSQERDAQQRSRGQEGPARDPADDAARAKSWAMARNLVKNSGVSEPKIYAAERVDAKAGQFRGTIVAVTDHHVVQRVGTNSYIAHDRHKLEGDRVRAGQPAQINYDNGKAHVAAAERRRSTQEQERPAPARPAPNRSQGMSR